MTHPGLDMWGTVSKTCSTKLVVQGALLHLPWARLGEWVLRCPGQEGTKVKTEGALRMKKALGCILGSLVMCPSEILSCL